MDRLAQQPGSIPSVSVADSVDYTFVSSVARIALYDDLRSAPRIIAIEPADTRRYIENLSSTIYEQARLMGGSIPYTVIREVSENFIHAQFKEIVVSVLDGGNTIRFADQGPGIADFDHARQPGFTSAIEPMKEYIRGVGSGLPIVCEYLNISHGSITFDENLGHGSVVTISMVGYTNLPHGSTTTSTDTGLGVSPTPYGGFSPISEPAPSVPEPDTTRVDEHPLVPPLTNRERTLLAILLSEGPSRITDLAHIADMPNSSTYVALQKLEEAGLVQRVDKTRRSLTEFGEQVTRSF